MFVWLKHEWKEVTDSKELHYYKSEGFFLKEDPSRDEKVWEASELINDMLKNGNVEEAFSSCNMYNKLFEFSDEESAEFSLLCGFSPIR